MNILTVHNFYQQPGGEDAVFADETKLLRDRGHRVEQFTVHNDAVESMGKLELARRTIWNRDSYDALRTAVRALRAEVVHFHNTFPLISPAGYRAAHDEGAAVVQTLHNYRLLCPTATFFRDGGICEDCLGKSVPWPGVLHKCYRDNRGASAVVAAMLTVNRAMRTWRDEVDQFIALTEFSRQKFIQGGFDPAQITVKPNFVDPDPGEGTGSGGYALFVGRLTEEKGVRTLLEGWGHLDASVPLKILGDGPLRELVETAAAADSRLQFRGRQPLDEVCKMMGDAAAVIFPSRWYEGLPRTMVESFAKGTPVIASDLGSMTELVDPGRTGFLFEPGESEALARQVHQAFADPGLLPAMRSAARQQFMNKYTAEPNARMLMSVYEDAIMRTTSGRAKREITPPSTASVLSGDARTSA